MFDTVAFFQRGMLMAMWLTLPPVLVAVIVGILVSLLQTMLSAQDQALPFAVKLIAVSLCLVFVGRWQALQLLSLGEQALQSVSTISQRVIQIDVKKGKNSSLKKNFSESLRH